MTRLLLEAVMLAAAAGWLALVAALLFRDRVRRRRRAPGPVPGEVRVQVIIPCRAHPELARNLEAFAGQRGVTFRLTVVTASASEPAAGVGRSLAARFEVCEHQVAGEAIGRGQKNHNLLAGLAHAAAFSADVVVFCDDDCFPADDRWLAGFAAQALSFESRGVGAVTTFREVALVGPRSLGAVLYFLGTAFQRASVSLTRQFVWGGALALTRRNLALLRPEEVWGDTVVDDVALSRALQRRGLSIGYAPGSMLLERQGPMSAAQANAWLFRQLQFLRYYMPAFLASAVWLWSTTVLAAVVAGVDAASGAPVDLAAVACVAGFGLMVTGSALLHAPKPDARLALRCLLVCPWTLWTGTLSGLRCFVTDRVVWGTRSYAMARDGTVVAITGSGSST